MVVAQSQFVLYCIQYLNNIRTVNVRIGHRGRPFLGWYIKNLRWQVDEVKYSTGS